MKKVYVIAALLAVLAGSAVYLFASQLQSNSEPVALRRNLSWSRGGHSRRNTHHG